MAAPSSTAKCALSNDIVLILLPVPSPDAEWMAATEARYPGLKIRWIGRLDEETGKERVLESLPAEVWDGVTILNCWLPPPARLIPKVRFVQLTSAGADRWMQHEKYKDPNVVFCTANGLHATQIGEWVTGVWLMFQHRFLEYTGAMKTGSWDKRMDLPIEDSPGKRMGILGYGAIGRQCARIAKSLGMEVYAYTRSEKDTPESRKDDSYCIAGTGDPYGVLPVKWFHGSNNGAVNEFLAQDLDVLVISLPLTAATIKIISYNQFEILSKKRTFLINIARGKIVDTEALVDALEKGKIRGAALDVTDPEPLPQDHPLWKAPNVFITPHVSWITPHYWKRCLQILGINLEKMNAGEPMINVINKEENY